MWSNLSDLSTALTPIPIQSLRCQDILFNVIGNSGVRVWDVIILTPNALFLLFLLAGLYHGQRRFRQTRSSTILTFYGLVWMVTVIGVVRAAVSMTITKGDVTDKVLWLVLRFFLLATELSVLVFGVFMGHLDNRRSILYVLVISMLMSLVYSSTQAVLEIMKPDPKFHTDVFDYDIFGHGGMLFWFVSSTFFMVVYTAVVALPYLSKLRVFPDNMVLPTKTSFYVYAVILALMNLLQAIGSMLLYKDVLPAMCVVDATSCFYFTCFAPLVYVTFLREFFKNSLSGVSFYKSHHDEPEDSIVEEDDVSLPYQTDNSAKTDLTGASYDSTHFNSTTPELQEQSPNPLYNPALNVNVIQNDIGRGQGDDRAKFM